MKRRLFILVTLLMTICHVSSAQQGLAVADIFTRYGHERGCKMVEMHDTHLQGYELKTYQSLTYRTQGEQIATMLETDRKKAKKIREIINDGHVTSGYYILPPTAEGLNRYVLYTQKENKSGAVIYIEGTLGPDDILRICYQRRTK